MSSTFGSSPLVRLFAQWAPAGAQAASTDLAEHLSHWVSAFDAIQLQAALRAVKATGAAPAAGARSAKPAAGLAQDFERARLTLVKAISLDPALPNEFTYAPYKRRHLELQRQMEQMVGALRDHVRQVLAQAAAPQLRQLAALDAALDKVLTPREQDILLTAVTLLEQRFAQLRKNRLRDAEGAGQQEEDPAAWRRPGGWLHAFEKDWHDALLAELHLRLEPVAGLVEAAGIELKHHHQ